MDTSNIIGKFYCIDDEIKTKLKEKYKCADMFALSLKDTDSDDDDSSDSDDDEDDIDESFDTSSKNETDDLCSVLADSLISQDWNMIGNIFFELPTTEELIIKLKK